MKLIIAGGRDYALSNDDIRKLDSLREVNWVSEVVSGGASGADAGGEEWAKWRGIPVKRFPADWGKYGRSAGPIRNREMAIYADGVVLFPGGKGTENMHKEAIKAGIDVWDWSTNRKRRG